jgi:hypothetical protein
MKLQIQKSKALPYFFSPISRLTDKCSLIIGKNIISSLSTTEDKNPILYATFNCVTDVPEGEEKTICIPDIKKLIVAFNCLPDDTVDMEITSNSIDCIQSGIKFKYHLLEETTLPKEIVSRKKIDSLVFDSSFVLSKESLMTILRGCTFNPNTEKIYFYIKDDKVFADINDKEIPNTDNIMFFISDSYTGEAIKTPLPIKIDYIKGFMGLKSDISVSVNTKLKYLLFSVKTGEFNVRYVVSPLIK